MNYNKLKKTFNIDTNLVDSFLNYLLEVNKKINLTSIVNKEEMILKHIYDSLTISQQIDFNNKLVLDVGSGGGFPGIVLAIMFKNAKFVLVDSTSKKVNYLNDLIKHLGLKNVSAKCTRVENLNEIEKYDVVISRAFSDLSIYLELVTYLAKVNGLIIALKGPKGEEEFKNSKNAINKLSLKLENSYFLELPENGGKRINFIFKKLEKTNKKYPREYSLIVKKPL